MRKTLERLLVAFAACALIMAVGCGDDAASDDTGGTGGAAGAAGSAGATGTGGTAGDGGSGGTAGAAGAAGEAGEAGSGGEAGAAGSIATPDCVEPLPTTAAGDWAPASRVTTLDIPTNAMSAEDAGCSTVGSNNGIGLSGLISILGESLTTLTQPDDNGDISLLLLAHLEGWEAGATADESGTMQMNLYNGDPVDGGYTVDLDSFEDSDPANGARLSFESTVEGCDLTTSESNFSLTFPVSGINIAVNLSNTQMSGSVAPAADGFSMSNGRIEGYLTVDSIIDLIRGIQDLCASPEAPSFCSQAGMILNGEPDTLATTVILPILRGTDSLVTESGVEACEGADCNAVSVCLTVETSPTTITGLSEN